MAFIDSMNNPIVREMRKDYNRAIAQKIRNRLQQLENANEKDKRRWVWELLQNANDTISSDRTVDVEIIVTEESIEFRHNGGYFSPRNITNLVHQISSKEGDENIGRFGTGFLTTHTLSRVIEVSGVFFEDNNYSNFKILLDRTGNTEAELVKCLEKTWETFEEVKFEEKPKEIVWTSFKYLKHNKEVAAETIKDFITFIHYNLAFVPSIGSVTVVDNLNDSNFLIKRKKTEAINELLSIITFEEQIDTFKTEKKLLFADNSTIQGAIEIKEIGTDKYVIQEIAANIPRIFCAFPLIGTEKFHFPMVLNSRRFMPKTERDGLYLKGDTTQANRNKPLLEDALSLYYATLEFAYNKRADGLYLLAQHKNPFQDDSFDIDWYEKSIQKSIQNKLLISPIVKTETGEFEVIKTIKFPYHTRDKKLDLRITQKIWEYQSVLYPNLIPQKSDVENWTNIIWEDCTKVSLSGFANYVQKFETIGNLSNVLNSAEIEVFPWLNGVIGFYIENGYYLLNQYKLCPNQEKENQGRFCLKNELYADDDIQEELKDVYEIFIKVTPWRKELLAREITTLEDELRKEKKIRRSNNIMQGINARIEHEETHKKRVKKAVFILLSLMPLKKEYEVEEKEKQLEHDKHISYRQDVYRFHKNLFKDEIPEIVIVDNLSTKTWEVSDKWALDYLVKRVSDFGNTGNLSEKLNLTAKEEASDWLNELFIFFLKENKRIYFSDKIFPNQLGVLTYKSALYQDENIAEEFKDILEELDSLSDKDRKGWRKILLDERITAFIEEAKLQSKTTQDISDEINKIIGYLSVNDFEHLKNPMFKLVTLINSENRHQRKLWEYLRTFYLDEVPKQLQIVENSEKFDWKPCFLWCVEQLILDISVLEQVNELQNSLYGDVKVIDWLNDLLDFIHETPSYKRLLDGDEYAIIPNQNNRFQIKNRLYLDNEIDEDLKQIIRLLNKNWLDDILDTNIYLELPNDREKTTIEAATEVDQIFRNYNDDAQKSEFVESFRIISKWLDKTDLIFVQKYMNWVADNKAELALSLLGSDKAKDEIFQIIQSGKAPLLSKIANDENFSDADLNNLTNNLDKVKDFLNHISKSKITSGNNINIKSLEDNIKEKTNNAVNSLDELIDEFNQLKETLEEIKQKEEQRKPKFTFRTEPKESSNSAGFEAIRLSNETARDRIYEHLNSLSDYDVSQWTKGTNTIIRNVKKHGITIGLVTKGADNKTIYMNSSERELLSDTKNFSELWVHSNGQIYQITLGEILKIWNVERIKIDMFDFFKKD